MKFYIVSVWFPVFGFMQIVDADSKNTAEELRIEILQPTDPLSKISDKIFLSSGDSVKLKCKSRIFRKDFSWVKQGDDGSWCVKQADKCDGSTLQIKDIQPSDSGVFECVSTHDHDLNKPSVRIFVKDDDFLEIRPAEVTITNETTLLNFTCKKKISKSGDLAKASWTLNGDSLASVDSRIKTYDNGTLLLKKPYGKHSGVYVCEMPKSEDGGTAINFVKVQGPGYVHQKLSQSQNLMQGDTAKITCEVYGFPAPTVEWFIEGKELSNSSGRIFYHEKNGVNNSILEIRHLEFTDRQNYTCRATNKHGSGEAHTLIRVKDRLAALWPFLGIVAEVVILVTIIFLYEKRRARREADETEDAAEQKKALTEGGSDVRQRTVKA